MARPISRVLSETQRKLLRVIAAIELRGEAAFVADLVKALRLKAESSITATLQRMARNDFITLCGGGRGRSRVVRLTPRGRLEASIGGVPVLGTIPAGALAEAIAQPDVVLDERELLPFRPGDFALKVKGDSMIGDGILDGDTVLLRPAIRVESGEVAAVLVGEDHEATLKRVYFDPGSSKVRLRPSNPRYAEQHFKAEDVKIAGVFRGLVRHSTRRR